MINVLHALAAAMEPFHRFDPAGWFAFQGLLGKHGAVIAAVFGLFCVSFGGREGIFRFVAVPLGLLLGVALTGPVVQLGGAYLSPKIIELVLPAALGTLAGIVPHTIAFVMLGSVGAMIGATVVEEHELIVGALPGFFFAGILGIVFARIVDTVTASALGGMLIVGAVLALFPNAPLVRTLVGTSWGPAIAACLLTAAGAALQLSLHRDADEQAAERARQSDKKQKAKEDRARDARFASYGKK